MTRVSIPEGCGSGVRGEPCMVSLHRGKHKEGTTRHLSLHIIVAYELTVLHEQGSLGRPH